MNPYRLLLIRRGLKADIPALQEGEIGLCTDTKEVFVGTSTGNKRISEQYDPATPANWSGTPPSDIASALDRLAAAVEGLLGGPIP